MPSDHIGLGKESAFSLMWTRLPSGLKVLDEGVDRLRPRSFQRVVRELPEQLRVACQTHSASIKAAAAPSALFPGSSAVEHSTVNRQIASSNLARGAIAVSFRLFNAL